MESGATVHQSYLRRRLWQVLRLASRPCRRPHAHPPPLAHRRCAAADGLHTHREAVEWTSTSLAEQIGAMSSKRPIPGHRPHCARGRLRADRRRRDARLPAHRAQTIPARGRRRSAPRLDRHRVNAPVLLRLRRCHHRRSPLGYRHGRHPLGPTVLPIELGREILLENHA